ncbi:uncharacterized protein LAESUDRAFT_666360 [Laetiporus sulphureus 93-53]|uniref:Uncharacterized protein n=1 Tax=Laetiporus sulphureus 93-53 TaxID=1314785 RepID=A0A165B6D8_9APHY|nr:uncharacterized protein LAESUDRAFT_666360 [Laetiporus sulphureus 93-53]KZT00345.1 hypothetical protein LAESUDRAFT_666360 [Laetiporus sulphureus 93-53]
MAAATLLLFILSTMHIVADARRLYVGIVLSKDAERYFQDLETEMWKNSVYGVETLVADAVLIYRCHAVWQRLWVIVVPVLGWCGIVVTGIRSSWAIGHIKTNANEVFDDLTFQWGLAFYATALATDFLATGLLAYKLWLAIRAASRIDGGAVRCRGSSLKSAMLVVLECGALYSLSLLVTIIVYTLWSNSVFVMIDVVGQIIPITFYIVIIRATMARVMEDHQSRTVLSEIVYAPPSLTETAQSKVSGPTGAHLVRWGACAGGSKEVGGVDGEGKEGQVLWGSDCGMQV